MQELVNNRDVPQPQEKSSLFINRCHLLLSGSISGICVFITLGMRGKDGHSGEGNGIKYRETGLKPYVLPFLKPRDAAKIQDFSLWRGES